ncbi:MAG: FtsX-like permease family protein, partial [Bacteroidota bacterium]
SINTMLASVASRTHEIGVLRAIGYGPVSVFFAFVLESAAIGVLGGIIKQARGIYYQERLPGKNMGMLMAGFRAGTYIPYLGILAIPVFIIFWFIYWSEINKIKKILDHGQTDRNLLDTPIRYIED